MPSITQPDPNAGRRFARSPLFLALVVTLANAAKPVLIDDAAYLTYARHIAGHPLDPYGFQVFWYTVPEPAFGVLCPPVVPYWLAAGYAVFGDLPAMLKLWLFPFVWVLAWAVGDLLRRFARGMSHLLPLIVLGPAILPSVNLMLDIPALALGLLTVAVFARAADRGSVRLAIAAGLIAGLAMQTKYTMLLIPPAIAWYGLTHRRTGLGVAAAAVAVVAFAGWESLLVAKYGQSHFVYHALSQPGGGGAAGFVAEKIALAVPLTGHLGCLGIGVGLVAAGAVGVPRRWLAAGTLVWVVGFALVAVVPHRWTVLRSGPVEVTATNLFWQSAGTVALVAISACGSLLAFRVRKGLGIRANADAWFLAGWLAIELGGYFVLTPFGAARRVIGIVAIGGFLAARAASRVRAGQRPPGWVVGFGVAAGFAVAAIDTLDAFPEKSCADIAAAVATDRPPGSRVWFAGHWGFQYYCERAGMRHVIPGESVLSPGDVLVLPRHPDENGFHRPHIGDTAIRPPAESVDAIVEVIWDDALAAQTIPNFYGGIDPIVGRDHPRLRVVVYRMTRAWVAPR